MIDGRETTDLPADDRGLAYGDGLFETMRLTDGVVPLLKLHLERLADGCRRLALTRLGIETAATVDAAVRRMVDLLGVG